MPIQAGAKVDAQDKELRTPLLEAIINNHIEVARYLIQNGASVYHVVSLGRSCQIQQRGDRGRSV